MPADRDDNPSSPVRLIAHRGDMARCPENTLAAIESALRAGADGVEFDVQMNAGLELVLLHDDEYLRTAGVAGNVFDPAGREPSVHEPARFGERFYPQAIPRLSQALAVFEAFPGATAWVEIKRESLAHWGMEPVMRALISELGRFDTPAVIISYDAEAVRFAKRVGALPVGWVLKAFDARHREIADGLKPDYLVCNCTKVNAPLWPGPWEWMLYDILDAADLQHWCARGVRLIETGAITSLAEALTARKPDMR